MWTISSWSIFRLLALRLVHIFFACITLQPEVYTKWFGHVYATLEYNFFYSCVVTCIQIISYALLRSQCNASKKMWTSLYFQLHVSRLSHALLKQWKLMLPPVLHFLSHMYAVLSLYIIITYRKDQYTWGKIYIASLYTTWLHFFLWMSNYTKGIKWT